MCAVFTQPVRLESEMSFIAPKNLLGCFSYLYYLLFMNLQDQSIRIHKNLSPDCQVMLFSATYDKDVMDFAENIVPNPVVSWPRIKFLFRVEILCCCSFYSCV